MPGAPAMTGRDTPAAVRPAGPVAVLHLEDEALDAELVAERLVAGGLECTVTRVERREDFVRALDNGVFDVILSDFSLPAYDGRAALMDARTRCPDVPFLFVSGALGEDVAIDTLRHGATDYVLKNRLDGLVPAVRRALREAEDRLARRQAEADRAQLLVREQAARLRAEQANRAKDEFLATVSHELRTPLTAITGWIRMLRGGRLTEDKRAHALETIDRNAWLLAQLVGDLLDVSRVITGKLRLAVRETDPAAVVRAAVEAVRPAADAREIQLEVALDPAVGCITADPDRLQQVVWNLLSNAIKFTSRGGRVEVALRNDSAAGGSGVAVVVTDTGQGIDPEFLPHVFERFRQADGGITRAHGGLGLGLAIVKHIVEQHGGTVEARSPGPGLGATFLVGLPRTPPRTESVSSLPPATQPPGMPPRMRPEVADEPARTDLAGVRILLVDDERDMLDLLREVLEPTGAEVTTARSAQEALVRLRELRPDVLVSDIGLPGEDGYDLVRQVRALPPETGGRTPAAALTAYARLEDRDRALAAGFDRHVAKPVEPAELLAVIAALAAPAAARNQG